MNNLEKITRLLISKGEALHKDPFSPVKFTGDEKADKLLNNINDYPHAFVLACIMDRQMKAERAWLIPHLISLELGSFKFKNLLGLDAKELEKIFNKKRLHRFNKIMAGYFYDGIQLIHNKYDDEASKIWANNPSSAAVVRRFLEFKGIGIKIATMATNILSRHFKIRFKDLINIDISPDAQIKRVFPRLGFVRKDASVEELIYCARELNPLYPGVFDLSVWEIGRNWCSPSNPDCNSCYLNDLCPKKL